MKKTFSIFVGLFLSTFLLYGLFLLYVQRNEQSTIQKNIPSQKASLLKQKEDDTTEIILVGDVMLGRSVMIKILEDNDYLYPFANVLGTLRNADIVYANLESPIVKNCPIHESGYKFCTLPDIAQSLSGAGIDVVTLANNHSRNYGEDGLSQTQEFLINNAIAVTGLGNLEIIEVNNTKFGFLGFDYTISVPEESDFDLIVNSKQEVDILFIGIHWGVEYTSIATDQQRALAKRFIDSGADVISGHHPHWVQEIEYFNGKPVYYSLGNFVFDQMWSEETKKGLVVRLTFKDKNIIKEELLSTYISSVGQPSFSD